MRNSPLKSFFVLIILAFVFSVGIQLYQFQSAMQAGDQAFKVLVYDPSTNSYDVYYTNEIKNIENGFVEFKDSFGIVRRESSFSIRIQKLK